MGIQKQIIMLEAWAKVKNHRQGLAWRFGV
jgi:hypothetical protein